MLRRRLLMKSLLLLLVITLLHASSYAANIKPVCSSSCGSISNIKSPFRLTTDPLSCGDLRYNLSCENNITVLNLPIQHGYTNKFNYQRYYVLAINYNNYTIRVVDPNFHKLHQNYPSSFTNNTSSIESMFAADYAAEYIFDDGPGKIVKTVMLISCERVVPKSSYIDASPCILSNNNMSSYLLDNVDDMSPLELEESCWIEQVTLTDLIFSGSNATCYDMKKQLSYGFQLSWIESFGKQEPCGGQMCRLNRYTKKVHCRDYYRCVSKLYYYLDFIQYNGGYKYIVGMLAPRTLCGILFVISLMVYKWRRRHLSIYDGIEDFLQSHNNLVPIRYSYREIRKMTNKFKEKLGEGGFGTVYKGQLCSGPFVAVKMLGQSKTNGQDFINEITTIGKIHHVNIVRLIGFCVEGTKRALIYDFMSNGSLDKYIFSSEKMNNTLSFTQVFEISLGIARGIEYLHQGCDMHILHFDIKPHNILLDENFIPKVSDFGLARSCSLDNSLTTLTAARGTMGYIAPELFYKNIGRVSNKSDVYSFGMLLMEMANRRKNVNALTQNSSHIYFPLWIHKQFSEGKDIEIGEHVSKEESETIKKMVIVALWCIQLLPCDRPTMNGVIEMLESNFECLQIPPNLDLYPRDQRESNNNETSFSSTLSEEDSTSSDVIN